MAFMIDNTPKKPGRGDSRLQRGINKLRKSPRTTSTKSPKIPSSAKKVCVVGQTSQLLEREPY